LIASSDFSFVILIALSKPAISQHGFSAILLSA
jgi:hypothetical protein